MIPRDAPAPGPWRDPNNPAELLANHCYLRGPDGAVIDPTRWCYEGKRVDEAFIYTGDGDGVTYDGRPVDIGEPTALT